MSWSIANLWDEQPAKDIAEDIAQISGLYCGPAAVGWIAAVWNRKQGRPYDYRTRLRNKTLFPDGPRRFFGEAPGFQTSLNALLKRETDNELKLSDDTHYKYGTIHDKLEQYDMPLIIRMFTNPMSSLITNPDNIMDGLHYVSLYKSQKNVRIFRPDQIEFYWQDNGLYGTRNGGNPGLYSTGFRSVGYNTFKWGAKRVVHV
jgi:hypothetical protein